MKLYTIGFTKKSAETFFTCLQSAGVKRLVDVRLNNVSQLAGFTKKNDLRYFADAICQIEYVHLANLAPTKDMLGSLQEAEGRLGFVRTTFPRPDSYAEDRRNYAARASRSGMSIV